MVYLHIDKQPKLMVFQPGWSVDCFRRDLLGYPAKPADETTSNELRPP